MTTPIANRYVFKTLDNTFSQGHLLFKETEICASWTINDNPLMIERICREITKCDAVFGVFCDSVVPSRIQDEIEWVSKYAIVRIIVQNDQIKQAFLRWTEATNVTVDDSAKVNYFGIRNSMHMHHFIMTPTPTEIDDDAIQRRYFDKHKTMRDLGALIQGIPGSRLEMFRFTDSTDSWTDGVIDAVADTRFHTSFIFPSSQYTEQMYGRFHGKKNTLYLSCQSVENRTVIIVDQADRYEVQMIDHYPIIVHFGGRRNSGESGYPVFRLLDHPKNVLIDFATDDVHFLEDGIFVPFTIEPMKVINVPQNTGTFTDFISKHADLKICDQHNEYSRFRQVKYAFELTPPKLKKDALLDERYLKIKESAEVLGKVASAFDNQAFLKEIDTFGADTKTLTTIITTAISLIGHIRNAAESLEFNGFTQKLRVYLELMGKQDQAIIEAFVACFRSSSKYTSDGKIDQIDQEIDEKQKLVDDRKKFVEQGVDVLKNMRRMTSLDSEILTLKAIRKEFIDNLQSQQSEEERLFLAAIRGWIEGTNRVEEPPASTFAKVLSDKDATQVVRLSQFAQRELPSVDRFIGIVRLEGKKVLELTFPETGVLYTHRNRLLLAITNEEQISKAMTASQIFNAEIVVMR